MRFFRQRRQVLKATAVASTVGVTAALFGKPEHAAARDRIVLPPERQVIRSAAGNYQLVISTADGWHTKLATAELTDQAAPGQPVKWTLTLPQTQGPRRAMVTDHGTTVMFDSWLNVASPHAIVVVSPEGHLIAVHSFDAIVALLAVSRPKVVQLARLGFWLAAEPRLSGDDRMVLLTAGGKHMRLGLIDGSLSVTD